MIATILYMAVALLAVYPLRQILRRTGVSGREATLAASILSTMWVGVLLYGAIAWCVSADARREVNLWRKIASVRAAATRSSQHSSTFSVEAASSAQSAG